MRPKHLIWLLIILFFFLLIYWVMKESSSTKQLEAANSFYVEGEKAGTIAERKNAFNQSLEIYQSLEHAYSPTFGNGKLYFNIANCYYQLEQYPLAIYYYDTAHVLRPRDLKVVQNLQTAQEKLGIAPDKTKDTISISLPERLQIFFGLSLLTLGFASMQIWFPMVIFKRLALLFGILSVIVFLNLAYIKFLAPVEGVIIHGTSLYRDAGEQYAKVSEKPLLAGIKVEVLDTKANGTWLKIQTPDGSLGFIPKDSIYIINP